MKRTIRGVCFIVLGVFMTFSAISACIKYACQEAAAGENAKILLENLEQKIQSNETELFFKPAETETPAPGEMVQTTMFGYDLIGILEIPTLDIKLPILDKWNYASLEISPCRYSGSREGDDLILLGHNYKKHFAPLKNLSTGDTVSFRDVNGQVYLYQVVLTEILKGSELERLTSSGYDLTIFTCTAGGYDRFVVRCERN